MHQFEKSPGLFRKRFYWLWLTSIAGCTFILYLMLASEGTHSHDEIGHFLISRDAWAFPELMMDPWGRFLHTVLYMIPARWGLTAARIFSLILSLGTVYFAICTARKLRIYYWFLVPLFLFFQPWFADLSFLNITQIPFMLLMIVIVWLFITRRWGAAAFISGLLPLLRHEGIALAGLLFLYLMYQKKWKAGVLAFIPMLAYNATAFFWIDQLPLNIFGDTVPNTIYGSGNWYHFLIRLPHPQAVGIPLMLLAVLGLPKILKSKQLIIISLWYVSYMVLHSVIFMFGLFASGGYKFFLLPMAPAFAVLACLGFQQLGEWLDGFDAIRFKTGLKMGVLLTVFIWCVIFVRPHELTPGEKAVKKAASWIQNHNLQNQVEAAAHVYLFYFLPRQINPQTLWESFEPPEKMESSSLVIWDKQYSNRWGLEKSYFEARSSSWKDVASFGDSYCVIYQKL